jgi:hypothetical protein
LRTLHSYCSPHGYANLCSHQQCMRIPFSLQLMSLENIMLSERSQSISHKGPMYHCFHMKSAE